MLHFVVYRATQSVISNRYICLWPMCQAPISHASRTTDWYFCSIVTKAFYLPPHVIIFWKSIILGKILLSTTKLLET